MPDETKLEDLLKEAEVLRELMSDQLKAQFAAEQRMMLDEISRLREKNERLHQRLAELTGEAYQGAPTKAPMAATPIMQGRVVNPGDPDWVPSPSFIPPAGWMIPNGWGFAPHLGWFRTIEEPRKA